MCLGILGGGLALGSLVMIMEDAEAPHHMLLLRNFMSQGLVHGHALLYASPSNDPRGFLGTLPTPSSSAKDDKSSFHHSQQVVLLAFCLPFVFFCNSEVVVYWY